jgi:hypothetical protein
MIKVIIFIVLAYVVFKLLDYFFEYYLKEVIITLIDLFKNSL